MKGLPGLIGARGEIGITGAKGVQGDDGLSGRIGLKGDIGELMKKKKNLSFSCNECECTRFLSTH